jgi:hypothetical protein
MAVQINMLKDLQKTTKEYVKKEKKRLENEAQVLEAILKGRTGGRGIQAVNTKVVSSVAVKDMAAYLSGK